MMITLECCRRRRRLLRIAHETVVSDMMLFVGSLMGAFEPELKSKDRGMEGRRVLELVGVEKQ